MIVNRVAFCFRLQFLVALLLGELIFVFKLPRRRYFPFRLGGSLGLIVLFFLFCPDVENHPPFSAVVFIGTLLLSVLLLYNCWGGDWMSCFFRALAGYNAQHIGSMTYVVVSMVAVPQLTEENAVAAEILQLLLALFVYAALYAAYGRTIANSPVVTVQRPALYFLTVIMVLIEIVLSDFIRIGRMRNLNFTYSLSASLIDLICTLSLMTIQFFLLRQYNLQQEMAVISQMLNKESQHYELAKETVDMINLKCDDMRHQIRAIGNESRIDPAAIDAMEQTIGIYDSIIQTGNRSLDIIFAEKSLFCQKNSISIQCIADGEVLSFMSSPDVYSLFGNILDNAIQSVIKLEDSERFIWLTVKEEAGFLSINSHNYYSGQIQMDGDMPISSNADTVHHGYGVRSIRTIAEKYDGTVAFQASNSIFNVNILIPLP